MRKNIPVTGLSVGLIALLMAAVFTSYGFAQDQQPIYQVVDIQVKTGMGPAFEGFMKSDVIPAMKKASVPMTLAFRTDNFGQAGKYTFFTPLESLSELDKPDPVLAAIGEEAMGALMAKLQPMIYEPYMFQITGREDLSRPPQSNYEWKLALAVSASVAPGRTEDFEKNLKATLAVLEKTNTKGVLTAKVGLGSNLNQYLVYNLFDSFADIQAFGVAFSKAMAASNPPSPAGIVVHQEMTVMRFLPELSILPAAPNAKQ